MAYNRDTERQVRKIRADVAMVADAQVRDLIAAWAEAWNQITPDLNATLLDLLVSGDRVSRSALMRSTRLQRVLVVIAAELERLSAETQVRIIGDLQRVIDIAGAAQASIIDSQLPAGSPVLSDLADWTRVDPHAVAAIVARTTQQITSQARPLSADAELAVRRELLRGFAAGDNPRQTAGRIIARTQGKFNGGLTRALTIVRTETLDASRAGAHLGRLQNRDVLEGWMWHCDFGPRTCPACIARDGQVYPLEEPGPIDHPCGRCTAVPKTKPWADLGIDLDEPEPIRQTAGAWFDEQPASVQLQILGPARYRAWKAGDYPSTSWVEVRKNTGWRDSIQVTRPPAAYSGGRGPSSLAS